MGWLTGSPEAKLAGFEVSELGSGDPLYPEPSFANFSDHAFGRNELVYACIMEKATSLPEAPLRVYAADGMGEPKEQHPLRTLIASPNPHMTEFELMEMLVLHLDLAGNAFWEIVVDRAGRPVELWPLRPDRVRIWPQKDGRTLYGVEIGNGRVMPLGENVVHFKLPNPKDSYVGQAPLRPALRAVALDNEATDFVKVLLQNKAVPGTVIETEHAINEKVVKRLTAKWMERFGGKNRGMPAFLQKGMKVHALGLDLQKLEFPDLRTISESRICMVFGVPPILVGAKVGLDRSTFANYAEARRSFWEETLMPLQSRIAQTIIKKLLPMVNAGKVGAARVVVRFDNSNVLALRESEGDRWEQAIQALRAGGITVNEFCRRVGLPPKDGADIYLRPAGVTPTDASGKPVHAETDPATLSPATGADSPAAEEGAKVWDLLPAGHPDAMKQCPTCRVIWATESKAFDCTEHHARDYVTDGNDRTEDDNVYPIRKEVS